MSEPVRETDSARNWDAAAFSSEVAEQCKPVVLRGLCGEWPAAGAASHSRQALTDYFAQFDSGTVAEAFVGEPAIQGRYFYDEQMEGFNFQRVEVTVAEALERIDAHASDPALPSIYLGSLPTDDHLPGFAEQNSLSVVPADVRPRIWLGNASSVACHYDTYDNIACVVAGRRRFTMYPPDAIGGLYVGPIDFTMAGQPVALAVGSAAGDPRFPRFEQVRDRALVVELEPGDALYLPKLWWHQVEATDPVNMLINYWWDAFRQGPDAPYITMMLAMIAIAERPPAERAAWRAFFDHYVFRPDGHPLAHLPESQRGILGPLQPRNYGRIRAFVMQLLRGG
jgi:hypothetical protein